MLVDFRDNNILDPLKPWFFPPAVPPITLVLAWEVAVELWTLVLDPEQPMADPPGGQQGTACA